MLIKITSNEKGKCCDLYPPMGVFQVKESDKGLEVITRKHSYIPRTFDFEILPEGTKTKACQYCKTDYLEDETFIDSYQMGETPMCLVCYERRHVTGDKYAYRETIRKQVLAEIGARPRKYKAFVSSKSDDAIPEVSESVFEMAKKAVLDNNYCSVSFLQRRLKVSYFVASTLMATLEANGIVGPENGTNSRDVLIKKQD